jgi:hypothetical protein
MIPAVVTGKSRRSLAKESFMPEICEECGSGVIKKLLQRSDGTAVLHRECAKGHKHHRITADVLRPNEPQEAATSFVMIEACDCG